MRILLVHPEDSLRSGPWVGDKWDLVVDLGKSSAFIRIKARPNTEFIPAGRLGNTMRFLTRLQLARPDIYFYPRFGPLDNPFFSVRRKLRTKTAVVLYAGSFQSDKRVELIIQQAATFSVDRPYPALQTALNQIPKLTTYASGTRH